MNAAPTRRRSPALRRSHAFPAGAGSALFPRLVPFALAGLAIFGIGISGYLAATHYADKPIVCGGLGQCDYVNSSEYASVAGIPVSLLGVAMYSGLFAAAALWALRPGSDFWPVAYWGMALAGAGYAGYLTYVELEVLRAICVWCVVSAVVLALSLLISTAYLLLAQVGGPLQPPAASSDAVPPRPHP